MQLDYREFRIDASPLDEGVHYYARAKIYRRDPAGGEAVKMKFSGDLGDYPPPMRTLSKRRSVGRSSGVRANPDKARVRIPRSRFDMSMI